MATATMAETDKGTKTLVEYRKEGNKAVIISRLPGEPNEKFGLRYSVTIK